MSKHRFLIRRVTHLLWGSAETSPWRPWKSSFSLWSYCKLPWQAEYQVALLWRYYTTHKHSLSGKSTGQGDICIYPSFQIGPSPTKSTRSWRLTRNTNSGERCQFFTTVVLFQVAFWIFLPVLQRKRDCLLRINVSLFEATEIQDRMNAQVTLQHLCTKFCKVSLCMHLQHTLPLYNYLSNAVPQVSVQQKPN